MKPNTHNPVDPRNRHWHALAVGADGACKAGDAHAQIPQSSQNDVLRENVRTGPQGLLMSNLALYLITVLVWGSTWFAIEFQLGIVEPEVSVVYRYAGASLAVIRVEQVQESEPLVRHS